MHGEKVAFGTIIQLVLENAPTEELHEVLDFCLAVGLPVCLEDIGVDTITDEELMQVAENLVFQKNPYILCHSLSL